MSRLLRIALLSSSLLAGALPVCPAAQAAGDSRLADSVRREVGALAAQGRLEQALGLVARHGVDMPAAWRAMFSGKLEIDGEASAQGYAGATDDSAPEQMRGEALFRIGQHHYAAGRHHLAIPQFRQYLAHHPDGAWAEASAYWMAHSCLQYARQRAGRAAYLDTAEAYLNRIESKGRNSYYWSLARAARARILLERGDAESRSGAARALHDARSATPPEETPAVLLLSLQAQPSAPQASAWEDSLRWAYPLSPETRSLSRPNPTIAPTPMPQAVPRPPSPPPVTMGGFALQLGAFAQGDNAERLRAELATKGIDARVAPISISGRVLHRVLAGNYPDAETAQREGARMLGARGYEFRVVEEKE